MVGGIIMKFSEGVFVNLQATMACDCTTEQCILHMYKSAIVCLMQHYNPCLGIVYDKNNNYDIDVYAYTDIRRNQELICYLPDSEILYILDEQLRNKYAAYIWYDYFIFPCYGMLLNNADDEHPANCAWDFNNKSIPRIVALRDIKKGESLRIDYAYACKNNYPPIPKDIIEIRKNIFSKSQ